MSVFKKYAIEVDLIGILILAAGIAFFLLPFLIYSFQSESWRLPMIISMIVVDGCLIIAFALYEKYLARKTCIPFELLVDRTVFFGGLMFVFMFASSSIWGGFFYSMLQVVWNLNVTHASYVSSIFRVGQCSFAIFIGLAIRSSDRFKWLAMFVGLPLMILAVGLMTHFRKPEQDIGFIAMTQMFVSFASGTSVICGELTMMAPSGQQHLPVILAILNLFGSIGSAIGGTIWTTILTSLFYGKLAQYAPPDTDITAVYSDIVTELSYPMGSPVRQGINRAYGETQRYMLIASF